MRQTWIGTGWKMNHTTRTAEAYARALEHLVAARPPAVQVFVVPPFTALERVRGVLAHTPVLVGAQNMHWEERGAFTGEISAPMLSDLGVQLVELGHSERRANYGETDLTVNLKVLAALAHDLRPLVCVGEPAVEKEAGTAREYLARQVKLALRGVPRAQASRVLLAYEPVWAIGEGGTPASPDYANAMHGLIREVVSRCLGSEVAEQVVVLYGGSVNAGNAGALLAQPNVDGLFVGRAAWQVEGFIDLIRLAEERQPS